MKNQKKISNSKLIAYSAAASAALAVAPNAFGTIIHNTVEMNFGDGYGSTNLTMEGSSPEFCFTSFTKYSFVSYTFSGFNIESAGNYGSVCNSNSKVEALSEGLRVGSNTNTPASIPTSHPVAFSISGTDGDWKVTGENKMLGVSFKLESGDQKTVYGWIAVEKIASQAGKVTAWAYEDDGNAIHVGAIPEPVSGLTLLALGAAGIAAYRRK